MENLQMTLNELMQKVIDAYPDPDSIAAYWNPETGKRNEEAWGDTLAEFIVIEIAETFDPETFKTDEEQLSHARHQLWLAMNDIVQTRAHLL
jgi:hypothetical protein